jgi:hypothetical protein
MGKQNKKDIYEIYEEFQKQKDGLYIEYQNAKDEVTSHKSPDSIREFQATFRELLDFMADNIELLQAAILKNPDLKKNSLVDRLTSNVLPSMQSGKKITQTPKPSVS